MARLPAIATDRLNVVPFTEGHLTARYVGWLNDPQVVRYSEQRHRNHDLDGCRAYWQSVEDSPHFFCAIEARDGDLGHIGNIGVTVDAANGVADIAIMVGERAAWGHGYAAEAWGAVMDSLFDRGLRKLTAGTMAVNTPMLRLMARSGMAEEGRRRRHFLWEGQEVDLVQAAAFAETR